MATVAPESRLPTAGRLRVRYTRRRWPAVDNRVSGQLITYTAENFGSSGSPVVTMALTTTYGGSYHGPAAACRRFHGRSGRAINPASFRPRRR